MENEMFAFIARYMELTDAEKQALTDLTIFRRYPKGTVLISEGEVSGDYFFVLKGCIRSYYMVEGEERTTEFYTEYESCTPLGSVHRTPSAYYIACVEDSLLIVANADIEHIIFERFPRFETLCRRLSEELLAQNRASFDSFKNATPEQRYLTLMHTRPDLLQRVPLHQLASYLGIKPESLSRIRKRLAEQGRHQQ